MLERKMVGDSGGGGCKKLAYLVIRLLAFEN